MVTVALFALTMNAHAGRWFSYFKRAPEPEIPAVERVAALAAFDYVPAAERRRVTIKASRAWIAEAPESRAAAAELLNEVDSRLNHVQTLGRIDQRFWAEREANSAVDRLLKAVPKFEVMVAPLLARIEVRLARRWRRRIETVQIFVEHVLPNAGMSSPRRLCDAVFEELIPPHENLYSNDRIVEFFKEVEASSPELVSLMKSLNSSEDRRRGLAARFGATVQDDQGLGFRKIWFVKEGSVEELAKKYAEMVEGLEAFRERIDRLSESNLRDELSKEALWLRWDAIGEAATLPMRLGWQPFSDAMYSRGDGWSYAGYEGEAARFKWAEFLRGAGLGDAAAKLYPPEPPKACEREFWYEDPTDWRSPYLGRRSRFM